MAFAKRIGIDLTGGFLFRPTSSDGTVIDKPFSSSAADARLKHYLREGEIGRAVSLHSFRSGCAITLALSGTELQDIMGHVGCHNRSTAAYYMQLSKVMSAGSPSSVLTGQTVNIEDPGIFYDQCNNLRRFQPFHVNLFFGEWENSLLLGRLSLEIRPFSGRAGGFGDHFHPSISHCIFMCIVGSENMLLFSLFHHISAILFKKCNALQLQKNEFA